MMFFSNKKDAAKRVFGRGRGRSALLRGFGALLLVACLLASMLPTAYAAADGTEGAGTEPDTSTSGGEYGIMLTAQNGDVVEADSWQVIKAKAASGGPVTVQLIENITANSACAVGAELIIDLNGHTIKSSGIGSGSKADNDIEGYVMAVVNGSLTITDSQGSGKFFIGDSSPHGLVYVKNGTLMLKGGTFENNMGHHAFRVVNGGTLTMEGGTIQNSGKKGEDKGGAFFVDGDGNLTINGGTIKNNQALTGAAIQFTGSGDFTMSGGEITGNTAGNNGGGLYFSDCMGEITFTGGKISDNTAGSDSHGGGMWFSNCPNITIGGTTMITGNTAATGGGIRLQDGANLTMTGGTISNNTANGANGDGASGIGGGISVTKSTVIINDGKISGNTATKGGGGIALRRGTESKWTTVTMNGGTISDNSTTGGQWVYGGGVYLQDYSSFTMNGGTISGNHGEGQGGGIGTDYGGAGYNEEDSTTAGNKCTGNIRVEIHGGTISGNYSTRHEGGGIAMGNGTLVIKAKDGNINITGNHSDTTQHWGGGGVFISDKAQGVIIDALIKGNSADGFGGGLGACSTGHVYYGVGADEDNPSALAAIFGNSAAGTNLSGGESKKDADHTAYNNSVFMSSGYQDVFSALEAVISGRMLGDGDEAWTGSADGAPVTVGKEGFASASQMLGLTSHATEEDRTKARDAAHVFITGNHSNTHGGGIMCNGSLAMGWNTKMDVTPGLAIKGTKQYKVQGDEADAVPEFHYAISNKKPTWVPAAEETAGHWQAQDEKAVFTTTNDVNGYFTFDLTFGEMEPCLKKETGTQTFYFWEVNDGGNGMTYDPVLYRVTVKVSEKTETKTVDKATLTINTWSVDKDSAVVEKRNPESEEWTSVTITQNVETNTNSTEPMHWTTRTVLTLTPTAFINDYNGKALLNIKKVNEDGTPLDGAEFTLYQMPTGKDKDTWVIDGKKTKYTYTSHDGGVIYADVDGDNDNLPAGVYRLVETKAPAGYKLIPGYIQFEIQGTDAQRMAQRMILCPFNGAYGAYVEVKDNGLTLQVKNILDKQPIELVKYGEDGIEPLAGATFKLYVKDDTAEGKTPLGTLKSKEDGTLAFETQEAAAKEMCMTDENNVLTGLRIDNTYILEETDAPAGYEKLGSSIEFTVKKDAIALVGSYENVELLREGDDRTTVIGLKMTDPEIEVKVAFLKMSGIDNKPLAGAKFELYGEDYMKEGAVNKEAKPLWSGKSTVTDGKAGWDSETEFPGLNPGTYYLVETEAPDGFILLDGPITVQVDPDGTVTATYDGTPLEKIKKDNDLYPGEDEDGTPIYAYVFTAVNYSGYELPESGGMGTAGLYALGCMALMTAALGLVCENRRRKAKG